jgi:hypothetical protein
VSDVNETITKDGDTYRLFGRIEITPLNSYDDSGPIYVSVDINSVAYSAQFNFYEEYVSVNVCTQACSTGYELYDYGIECGGGIFVFTVTGADPDNYIFEISGVVGGGTKTTITHPLTGYATSGLWFYGDYTGEQVITVTPIYEPTDPIARRYSPNTITIFTNPCS